MLKKYYCLAKEYKLKNQGERNEEKEEKLVHSSLLILHFLSDDRQAHY